MTSFPHLSAVKVMQGKESIAVDITSAEGLEIVYELVDRADVVLQSFRAGVATRRGLSATTSTSPEPPAGIRQRTGLRREPALADADPLTPRPSAPRGHPVAQRGKDRPGTSRV